VYLQFLYERRIDPVTAFIAGAVALLREPATFGHWTMLTPAYAATPVAIRPPLGASASRNAIAEILTPADILLDLDASTKGRALEEIARFIGKRHGLADGEVHASLVEREKIGSTAIGCGVAIPHARVKNLFRPIAVFVRMKIPIPFDAPDGKPVDDLFVLLVPKHATETHLSLLAQVAEMFCDVSFREELRASAQIDMIHGAFANWRKR
jgi:nitrogen PTS system EIIA component